MRLKQVGESARQAVEHMNQFRNEFQSIFLQEKSQVRLSFQIFINKKIRKTAGKNLVKVSKEIKNSFCKKCFCDLDPPLALVSNGGRNYRPLFCSVCQKVRRKDFIVSPKIKDDFIVE